jgi:hypothetical protein
MIRMEEIEQDSYSYYRLHQKIALVSLLTKERRKQQQQQQGFPSSSTKKYLGIFFFFKFLLQMIYVLFL